ncbi:MAG: polysaccharide deacetylase family protein [Oscillospiraceae bacterium]|nr:polysaccharide deacetylase family protein [Oscillospiraceae bacterium]
MKLIVTRIGVKKEKPNRKCPSVRLRTKALTVLAGTALTIAVCLLAEKLPEKTAPEAVLPVSADPDDGGFLLRAVCYDRETLPHLAADLVFLEERGAETVTCSGVIAMARGLADIPDDPVLLLFEGDRSAFTAALPLLEEYGARGNVILRGADADLYSDSVPKTGDAGLSWNEIRSLENSGFMEMISGGYGKPDRKAGLSEWRTDLLTMQRRMSEEIYHDASVFAHPSGEAEDDLEKLLGELGFLMTLEEGDNFERIDGSDDLFGVDYIRRGEGSPAEIFTIGR